MRRLVLVIAKPAILERLRFATLEIRRMSDETMALVCVAPRQTQSALVVGPIHHWIQSHNPTISHDDYDVVHCADQPYEAPEHSVLFVDLELRRATVGPRSPGLHPNLRNDPYGDQPPPSSNREDEDDHHHPGHA